MENRERLNNSFYGRNNHLIESTIFPHGILHNRERQQTTNENVESKLIPLQLKRIEMPKDGSCMFRAFSHVLYQSQRYHYELRLECVNYISRHRNEFEPFIESYGFNTEDYLNQMSKAVQWGGNIEVQALSMLLKRNVKIYSFKYEEPNIVDNGFCESPPVQLWHSHGEHFDALMTQEQYEVMTFCQEIIVSLVDLLMGSSPQSSRKRYSYYNFALKDWENSKKEQEKQDEDLAKEIDNYEKSSTSHSNEVVHRVKEESRVESKSDPPVNTNPYHQSIPDDVLNRIRANTQPLAEGKRSSNTETGSEASGEEEDIYKEKKKTFLKSLKHLLPHKKEKKEKKQVYLPGL
eukprot:TRINITY_DN1970_c0_g1_i1.p1 TRINITY_DN1970_c0_g1~~TRINITY_DN1970_c0_g1_i1.p1  ORF type:complete len:348 (-),score=102.04 TRINITY_DN1970_c0_g1_i1:21-1064(-)